MPNMQTFSLIWLSILFIIIDGFIPHPYVRVGGQAGDSVTHTEITQLGFIRSLARYLSETKSIKNYDAKTEYTIDELYELINPSWNENDILVQTYPLKKILDIILAENALVDFDSWTKKLPAAHFDSEAFVNGSRRIMKLRRTIIEDTLSKTKDLDQARRLLGQLLHTLQDFYSHSNWIELGKKDINEYIGIQEDIGPVAGKNQATCTSDGCREIKTRCSLLQLVTIKKCPLDYYECKNNIRSEILQQGLLTSGYSVNQHNEDNQPVVKPTNVEKCSHGSVLDTSSHLPAFGGINKDTVTSIYSPHSDLHFEAASMAVMATERFFNDLRKEIGDENFNRFFTIHPTQEDLNNVPNTVIQIGKFHFFSPYISSGLNIGSQLYNNLKKTLKARLHGIASMLFGDSDEVSIEDVAFRRKRYSIFRL